ncbi:MAG: G8 domain-containing protein [Pseudomonadota bacterium]
MNIFRFKINTLKPQRKLLPFCTMMTCLLFSTTLLAKTETNKTTAIADGLWRSSTIWSHGVPDKKTRAIIPPNRKVYMWEGDFSANGIVIQGELEITEKINANVSLTTDWVHVNSGGKFRIGSKINPYNRSNFTLNLVGKDPEADWTIETAMGEMTLQDNNGFLMAASGGSLEFYGGNKLTFTRLSESAESGSQYIDVHNVIERNFDGITSRRSDGALNWQVGDEIVVASSSYNYRDEEVRKIKAIERLDLDTTRLILDFPLKNRHYGQIETYGTVDNPRSINMKAEVAVLNRNIKIQGLASQDTDEFFGDRKAYNAGLSRGVGGHIMIMENAGPILIDSVQLHGLGQTGRLGRYPIHWHLAGDRSGDQLRGVSVTNSNNRGVTIHGTHNVLIQDVLLHDIHGHGFFMEDAVETGNTYLSNITLGIHKVGRSAAVGDRLADLDDPFIVDTHDHVGQHPERFLSSAGYWMTNPDNTWRGNVSAGSEGTGFWFLFPRRAIGASALDPQYAEVVPDKVNLKEFAYNVTHSSPIGFNVDRGGDIEVPIGAVLLPNFNGVEYNPPEEPQFSHLTAYKTNVAIYHRGRVGNFVDNKFADNFNSTFLTFTQRITRALYIGHSQGNSDPNQIVSAHTFYDGANTLEGTHFAGFAAANAHMFRSAPIAGRHTHFVMRQSSFEDDGSANHVSFVNPTGGNFYEPLGKMAPSVIFDEDGSFTGHVGGGAGYTIIPNHPYYYDTEDFKPEGWNARVSDERYALMRLSNFNGSDTTFQVTTPDGDSASDAPGTGQFSGSNALVKMNSEQYVVDFLDGLESISGGFDIAFVINRGPREGSSIVKVTGAGEIVTVTKHASEVDSLEALREATTTSFAHVGQDIYVKFFATEFAWYRIEFRPI